MPGLCLAELDVRQPGLRAMQLGGGLGDIQVLNHAAAPPVLGECEGAAIGVNRIGDERVFVV